MQFSSSLSYPLGLGAKILRDSKAAHCDYIPGVPRKIRELVRELGKAGWVLEKGGKGSHRKFGHVRVTRKLILSGPDGADAKRYQEKDVQQAVNETKENQ